MTAHFQDRADAGRMLAGKLARHQEAPLTVVVALPRGGVPVGREVASRLGLPLDILVVRKLGVPGNEEYAMGAIASGGVRVINAHAVALLRIGPETMDAVAFREGRELERRERVLRRGRPALDVRGKTVLLVDDGVATGCTLRAAVQSLRKRGARRVVAAVPTIAQDTLARLRSEVDEWVVLIAPASFRCVGEWYASFPPVTDDEVAGMLEEEGKRP